MLSQWQYQVNSFAPDINKSDYVQLIRDSAGSSGWVEDLSAA